MKNKLENTNENRASFNYYQYNQLKNPSQKYIYKQNSCKCLSLNQELSPKRYNDYKKSSKNSNFESNISQTLRNSKENKIIDINNYIERIRYKYEQDGNDIKKRHYLLKKELLNSKEKNDRSINILNEEINNTKIKNEIETKNILYNNEYELKNISEKKKKEINLINDRNIELEKANNDLIKKINIIKNRDKYEDKNKILYYQSEIKKFTDANEYLKQIYEKKIEYIEKNFLKEKNKLINSLELYLEKMDYELFNSKNKLKYKVEDKENKIKRLNYEYNKETNELNGEINYLNNEINKVENEINILEIKNKEIELENEKLKENNIMAKKDIKFQIQQKDLLKTSFSYTQNAFYRIKKENEKLNRLIYGNFKNSICKVK